MVSDTELVDRLREFLRSSDLTTTSTAAVRRRLEEDFDVDLTDRKAFIRDQVDLFLSELEGEKKEAEEEEEKEEEEEEEAGDNEGSVVEEEDEVDEQEEKSTGSSRKKGLNKQNKEVKKRGGGFTKLCSLSPQLQEFVGVSELARTEVVKKLWAYIRENNLQDPSNRRKILCDETLQNLFNVDTIDMFQMNKALAKHIWPLGSEDAGPAKSVEKKKPQKKEREGSDESSRKEKKQKVGSSGFLAPLQLSDALVKFIGTGENELPRSDVVKKIWEYIKQNKLQDPADKRNILCDDKLKELFQVDSFNGFTVPKLLAAHFTKSK